MSSKQPHGDLVNDYEHHVCGRAQYTIDVSPHTHLPYAAVRTSKRTKEEQKLRQELEPHAEVVVEEQRLRITPNTM